MTPSHCDPTYPRGSWFKHIFIYPTWECCNTRLSFSSWSVSEKHVFKDLLFIFLHHDLNKLYATQPEGASTQVPALRVNWFLRWFLKYQQYFNNSERSPFEKRRSVLFLQTWIPFTQWCFMPNLVEIGLLVLEKKSKT